MYGSPSPWDGLGARVSIYKEMSFEGIKCNVHICTKSHVSNPTPGGKVDG